MVSRLVSTVVLVACAGISALAAAERGTLILISGERRSGELVSGAENSAILVDGQIRLTDAGREQTVPIDQVAVIDLTGGTASVLELSRVLGDPGVQVVVLRSGHAQSGKFVNIIRGDTLLWSSYKGQEQYPLRDVSRVYLNPNSARTTFNNEREGRVPPRSPQPSGQPAGAGVRVAANQAWTDAGITVNQGDRVLFQASGQISYGRGSDQTATPDGGADRRANTPVQSVPVGALIGKIDNGAPFGIGRQSQPLPMNASGRLMLGVNDSDYSDNSGFFDVVVTAQSPQPGAPDGSRSRQPRN